MKLKIKQIQIDRTIQITLILLLMMICAAWLFRVFSIFEVWQQVFAAVLSVAITAVVTKVLLKGQTEAEQERERQSTIFEEKQKIYKDFLAKIEAIVKDERVDNQEIKELIFQISNLSMHTQDARVNDILLRLLECIKCLPDKNEQMSEIQTKRFAKNVIRLSRSLKDELYETGDRKQGKDNLNYLSFGHLIDEIQSRERKEAYDLDDFGNKLNYDTQILFWNGIINVLKSFGFKFTKRACDFDQWESGDDILADIEYYYSHSDNIRENCSFGFNILLPVISDIPLVYRIELRNDNISRGFAWVNKHEGLLKPNEQELIDAIANDYIGSCFVTNDEWASYEPVTNFNNINFQQAIMRKSDKVIDLDSDCYRLIDYHARPKFFIEFLSPIFIRILSYLNYIGKSHNSNLSKYNFSIFNHSKITQITPYFQRLKARCQWQLVMELEYLLEQYNTCIEHNDSESDTSTYLKYMEQDDIEEALNRLGYNSIEDVKDAIPKLLDECKLLYNNQVCENDPESLWLIYCFYKYYDLDKAIRLDWLQKAAKLGYGLAQFEYANFDEGKELQWLQSAAEQKIIEAQTALGEYYNDYNNDIDNEDFAFILFRKAAKFLDAKALFNLGEIYASRNSIDQNLKIAFYYYTKAARQGNIGALISLANCYLFGKGCTEDQEKASEIMMTLFGYPIEFFDEYELYWYRLEMASYSLSDIGDTSMYDPRSFIIPYVEDKSIRPKDFYYYSQILESEEEAEKYNELMTSTFKLYSYIYLALEFCKTDALHTEPDYEYAILLLQKMEQLFSKDIEEFDDGDYANVEAVYGLAYLGLDKITEAKECWNSILHRIHLNELNRPCGDFALFEKAITSLHDKSSHKKSSK